MVFQPLALLAAFTVGFKGVAHVHTGGVPYVLFALAGLAVWTYFQAVTMVATGSIVNNYPARAMDGLPAVSAPTGNARLQPPVVTDSRAWRRSSSPARPDICGSAHCCCRFMCLWLLRSSALTAVLLSAITVRARDVLSVVPFMLQVTLFLSPVAYPTTALSPVLRALISINPLTGLLDAWRWSLLGVPADLTAVIISLALTAIGIVLAWRLFARLEVRMADEI